MSKLRDSKTYSINDFLSWDDNGELELSPKFQRNKVWNLNVKSYLIDSIIRGMPIPPVFITQKIDLSTRKTLREVIDGQQRLTSIKEFKNNEFTISKTHNEKYSNIKFEDLPEDIKIAFLEYEIPVEIIKTEKDAVIYDIFARLNTNNISLNKQELRNSKYWGEFKVIINKLAFQYKEDFEDIKTFTDAQFSRMLDAEFIVMLMRLVLNGITTDNATSIDSTYKKYDSNFDEKDEYLEKFYFCMNYIFSILKNNSFSFFNKKVPFYTLFAAIYHIKFNLNDIEPINNITLDEPVKLKNLLYEIESKIERIDTDTLSEEEYKKINKFIDLHKTRTTSQKERKDRIELLLNEIKEV